MALLRVFLLSLFASVLAYGQYAVDLNGGRTGVVTYSGLTSFTGAYRV
jgi:hypothetical protein